MKVFRRSLGSVARINGMLLLAAFYAAIAWISWPTHPQWWGFGVISVLSACACLGALIQSLREMTTLYLRDRTLADYESQAKKQKNADLASDETLRQAGVIDG